jgi:lysophospholipase L1-like esterase
MTLDRGPEPGVHAPEVSSDRRFRVGALGVGLLLWLAITLVATELIEYSRNTLDRNGSWISSKPMMQMYILGTKHFLATRNALSGNRLNLGEWFGFNEVHLARPVRPAEMRARFRLDPGAYLDVILDRREAGHQGIRLSRAERFPSEWYRAERTGNFVERVPVSVPAGSLADGWHELSLVYSADAIAASLDGDRLGSVPIRFDGERYVGFGSGLAPAAVDRVRITGRSGELLFEETFRNRRDYAAIAAGVGLVGLFAVLLGGRSVLSHGAGAAMRFAAYRWLSLLVATVFVLATIFAFDYGFWSRRYVYDTGGHLPDRVNPPRLAVAAELVRSGLFRTAGGAMEIDARVEPARAPEALRRAITAWDGALSIRGGDCLRFRGRSALAPDILTDEQLLASPEKGAGVLRVAFLGTSQTRGVGAETVSDTFVARAHAGLAAALGNVRLETFNLSIPGSRSSALHRRYRQLGRHLRPDLLVVNLSNNDPDRKILIRNLRALAAETRRSGGRIVFVLEANSPQRDLRNLLRAHDEVRALGAELGVPVWDLHGYLAGADVYDSGRLWWDHVHLTSYGQGLTAEWLAARTIALLRGEASSEPPARLTVRDAGSR